MKYDKLIRDLLESFDWDKIRTSYRVLKMTWKEKDNHGNEYTFFPTAEELKEELFLILRFAVFKNIGIVQSGSWLIMWHEELDDAPAKLEAYLVIEESSIESATCPNIEQLKMKLSDAIKDEKYEVAALIRDKIKSIEKNV